MPTLAQFADRFVEEYAIANRQKPSTIASKRLVLYRNLIPQLGRKRLDEINHEDIQKLKAKLVHLNPKTVRRGEWEGEVISPKGGRSRVIPMSKALKKALGGIRHLRGSRVFLPA